MQLPMFDFNRILHQTSNSKHTCNTQPKCLPNNPDQPKNQSKKLIRFGSFKSFNQECREQTKEQSNSQQISPRSYVFPFLHKGLIGWEGNYRVNSQQGAPSSFNTKIQFQNGNKNSMITETKTSKNIGQKETQRNRLKKVTSCIAFDLKVTNQPAIKMPAKRIKRLQFIKKDRKGHEKKGLEFGQKIRQEVNREARQKYLDRQNSMKKENKSIDRRVSDQMLKQMKNISNMQKYTSAEVLRNRQKYFCYHCKQRVQQQSRVRSLLHSMQSIIVHFKKEHEKLLAFLRQTQELMMNNFRLLLDSNYQNVKLNPLRETAKIEMAFDRLEEEIMDILKEELNAWIPTRESKAFGRIKRNIKNNREGQIFHVEQKNESISKISYKNTNTNQDQVILDFNVFCKAEEKKAEREMSFEFSDAVSKLDSDRIWQNSLRENGNRLDLSN